MLDFVLLAALAGCPPQQPELRLTMTVCTPTGEPLAQAVAHVADSDYTAETLASMTGARADAQGRAEVVARRADSDRMLVVMAPGHTTQERWLRPLALLGAHDLGPVILFPAIERTGRVRDEQGRPLAGVRVCAADPLALFDAVDGSRYASAALTDERGFFRLRGALPDSVELTFTKWGHHGTALHPVRAEAPVDVALAAAPVTTGRLQGMPADARVVLAAECPDAAPMPARVAADGTFEVTAPARGRYRILVEYRNERLAASKLLRGAASGVLLAAASPDHPLEVHITIAGKPAKEFWIQASWEAGDDFSSSSFPPPDRRRHVDGGGVTLTVPGWLTRAELWIGSPGAATRRVRVADATETDRHYDLDLGVTIMGRAVDAATRQPIAGVRIGIGRFFSEPAAETAADGRFRIEGLRAGTCSVIAEGPDGSVGTAKASIAAGAVLDVGDIAMTPCPDTVSGHFGGRLPRVAWVRKVDQPDGFKMPYSEFSFWPRQMTEAAQVDPTTKRFTLGGVSDDSELQLLVPPSSPLGPELAFPVGHERRSPEVRQFAVHAVPGTIGGSVQVEGTSDALPLRVIAANERGILAAVAEVDAGGNFGLHLPEGEWLVLVVDPRTSIALTMSHGTVPVRAGESVTHDLKVTLHEVSVRVRTTGDSDMVANSVTVRSSARSPFYFTERQVPLSAEGTARLWLPAGEYSATAITDQGRLALSGSKPEPETTAWFTVAPGDPTRVEIVIPPPRRFER